MLTDGAQHPSIRAPMPDVTTDRLDLRRFRAGDLDRLAALFAKPEVWQFPYGRGFTRGETAAFLSNQLEEWDERGFGCWIAIERVSGRMLGYVGISVPVFLPEVLPAVEVGWRFDPDVWGKGYATEGARAALAESFTTLGLDEVCSVPQTDNPASSRVCERLGMRLEREVVIPANERRGELTGMLYKMTRDEWLAGSERSALTPALEEFGPSLYVADGPSVPFLSFPYPTRMALVRLSDGSSWVWSPIALTPELASAVDAIGPVRHIVSPNKIHHLFMQEWAERWPDARMYAPPGLARRRPDLRFAAELGDEPDPAWASEIDQVVFRGSLAMSEVGFFHRASGTAIIGDLVQRHDPAGLHGIKGMLMRLDGLVGEHGSTPREWRASFLRRNAARAAREELLAWKPERLVIAHGVCAHEDATRILARALRWM